MTFRIVVLLSFCCHLLVLACVSTLNMTKKVTLPDADVEFPLSFIPWDTIINKPKITLWQNFSRPRLSLDEPVGVWTGLLLCVVRM